MSKWFSNGQRVYWDFNEGAIQGKPLQNGTVIYARGDYCDIRRDDGREVTIHNGYLTATPEIEIGQ